ncbi:MAG: hypothetical protein K8S55_02045 [Phycisphaerae bacterium]|nr:hypothetical protein [Phycisphaerae bacterium]
MRNLLRNFGLTVVILLAVLSAGFLPGLATAADTPKPPTKVNITISRETTYILGPVNEDGSVNYLEYFNNKYSRGVTKENNAFVLLLTAIGPKSIDKRVLAGILTRLGMESLPAKGEYFINLYNYAPALKHKKKVNKQFDKAKNGPWSAKDYPILADWLKANEKPLALAQKAAQRPRYFAPMVYSSDFAPLLDLYLLSCNRVKRVAGAMICRAMLKYGSGDIDGAWVDLLTAHQIGQYVGQGPFEYIFGHWASNLARRGMAKIAVSGKLTAKQARRFLAEYNKLPRLDRFAEMENRRLCTLDTISFLAEGGSLDTWGGAFDGLKKLNQMVKTASPNLIDWNEVMRAINRLYDRQIKIYSISNASERELTRVKFVKEIRKLQAEYWNMPEARYLSKLKDLIENARKSQPHDGKQVTQEMIKLVLAADFPTFGRVIEANELGLMHDELIGIALALAAYKAEKGAYPQKLAELSPAYLKTIPADRISGKPLIYKTRDKGFLLYSVGTNQLDDGGKKGGWSKKKGWYGDIIIEVK